MKIDVLTLVSGDVSRLLWKAVCWDGRSPQGSCRSKRPTYGEFSHDKHNKADDYPFGGGGGMVMMADPVFGAMESVEAENKKVIYMSPRGKILDREKIRRTFEDRRRSSFYAAITKEWIRGSLDHWNAEESLHW